MSSLKGRGMNLVCFSEDQDRSIQFNKYVYNFQNCIEKNNNSKLKFVILFCVGKQGFSPYVVLAQQNVFVFV